MPTLNPLFNRLFSIRSSPSDSTLALANVNLKYWPVLTVLAWTLFAALINTGQFGDNIEQFNWAHSFEWGYYKHPPLPTWLLRFFTLALGQSPYETYLLGFICLAATGVLTHDIARRLLGLPVANFAIVLWSLQIPFNWRAQVYNHNTLLVLTVALTVWCLLNALSREQRRWWLATGFAAGLSLLSKYQALVPLAGMMLALALQGRLKHTPTRIGLLLAALVATCVIAPHLSWLIDHDFQTLLYASRHDQHLNLLERNVGTASFFVNQLRFLVPALMCVTLVSLIKARRPINLLASNNHNTPSPESLSVTKAWMFGLLGFPVIVLMLMSLGRGVALQNHWGMQSLQFLSLWLALRIYANLRPSANSLLTIAAVIHLVYMAIYAHAPFATKRHFFDLYYPSKALVQRVDRTWQAQTNCPLNIVSGQAYAAGLYSAYSAQHPPVIEGNSAVKSPWVSQQAIAQQGAMYFSLTREDLPTDVLHVDSMPVFMDASDKRAEVVTFYWGVKLPQSDCSVTHQAKLKLPRSASP